MKRRTKKPLSKAEIGLKAGRVLNRHKVGKHFALLIEEGCFRWQRKQQAIEKEAALDGIYVVRGSEPATELSAEDAVRNYKRLGNVEQAFRTLKGVDLMVRPIYHHVNDRVRAHLFVCLMAYHVQWHLKQAWASLLFADEQLAEHRATRDPVVAGPTGGGGPAEKLGGSPDARGSRGAKLPHPADSVRHAIPPNLPIRRE